MRNTLYRMVKSVEGGLVKEEEEPKMGTTMTLIIRTISTIEEEEEKGG